MKLILIATMWINSSAIISLEQDGEYCRVVYGWQPVRQYLAPESCDSIAAKIHTEQQIAR